MESFYYNFHKIIHFIFPNLYQNFTQFVYSPLHYGYKKQTTSNNLYLYEQIIPLNKLKSTFCIQSASYVLSIVLVHSL